MIINDLALKNKATVFVIIFLIVIAGSYSYIILPKEAAPEFNIPMVVVTTTYQGTTPTDIENLITISLENKIKNIGDIEEIRSSSADGVSNIVVEFTTDIEISDALQKVRDKVDLAKRDLPPEADESIVSEINTSEFPIMLINLSGDVNEIRLKELAEDLEEEIETISGILDVQIIGGREREIRIEFNPDLLASYKISMQEIYALFAQENLNSSGGNIEMEKSDFKYSVRIPGEFSTPDEIENLIIFVINGKPVYLSDVSTIAPPEESFKDRTTYARLSYWKDNDENSEMLTSNAVTLSIQKRSGENILALSKQVMEKLDEFTKNLPQNIAPPIITFDASKDVNMLVKDLENNIFSGLILVVLVLFLFLGMRNSIFVAMCIPLSMMLSFMVLNLMDIRMNMVVLFSLILSLGMLVDNAIVIVENIYRHMGEGLDHLKAAFVGSREVAWPIITSTLTTLCAFGPMIAWPGLMGEFMKYLPVTVIITLSSSLFVAMVINPVICATFMKHPHKVNSKNKEPLGIRMYRAILDKLLSRMAFSIFTIIGAVIILVITGVAYGKLGKGVELFPETEPNRTFIDVTFPQGTKLDTTDKMVREIESRVKNYKDIESITSNVGSSGVQVFVGNSESGPNVARLSIDFQDMRLRSRKSSEITKEIRENLVDFAGAKIKVEKEKEGPASGAPITIEVSGENFEKLNILAKDIQKKIKDIPGLVDLRDDYVSARPEIEYIFDRSRMKFLKLNTATAATFIKACINGMKVSKFREGNDEYDITIRLAKEFRDDLGKINSLYIPDYQGNHIPLSSIGTPVYTGGLGSINRKDLKRVIKIEANNHLRPVDQILKDCKSILANYDLPKGYEIEFAGEDKEQQEAMEFLTKAFVIAVFLILMVLVSQFNSITLPGIIIVSVILSFIGVLFGLMVTGTPFGIIMTGIGVVSLAGVVVNNAIVLIDYIQQLRRQGVDKIEAIAKAGATRLRPVLLTAVTTILGLIPMAIGVSFDFRDMLFDFSGESSQWWGPMAIAVIFGLGVSTILTLVVVPVMYHIVDAIEVMIFGPKNFSDTYIDT